MIAGDVLVGVGAFCLAGVVDTATVPTRSSAPEVEAHAVVVIVDTEVLTFGYIVYARYIYPSWSVLVFAHCHCDHIRVRWDLHS